MCSSIGKRHAGLIQGRDAHAEDRFHAGVANCLRNHRPRVVAGLRRNQLATLDEHDPDVGVVAEDGTQPPGHLGRGFDSGEAASRHDDGVAGLRRRLLRQRMEVVVELDGFIHQVDAKCVLRKARNVGAETGAAGSQDQSVVGQRLKLAFGPDEARQAGRAVDRLDRPLHVADIDLAGRAP